VFYNLIVNSIKYRRKDVTLVIEIKSSVTYEHVILSFKDNGLGIDLAKNHDRIFRLYKRFHSHVEGKGMGLFMVKTQIEALGGKINVNSVVNEGTEFIIEFEKRRLSELDY
jgi:signal transduction histidine kinase